MTRCSLGLGRASWLLALVPALVACSDADVDGVGEEAMASDEAAIVGGSIDNGDPAVVALTVQGQAFCTGTLVTPTVVVSAAHCIHPDIGVSPPTAISVYFGTGTSGGTLIPVVEGQYHPSWSLNGGNGDNDISVLRLAQAAPTTPIPMMTGSLTQSFVGQTVRMIGFGITQAGGQDSGIKRQTTIVVGELYPKQWAFPENGTGTCNGDSGGTALANFGQGEVLVGIHTLSDCTNYGVDERIDVHRTSFIDPFIGNEPQPTCAADGLCAANCGEPDPDCPCAADGFCTAACPNVASDPDCDPACAQNGVCVEVGCPVPDPDCGPNCVADGLCDPGCAFGEDPDCQDPCAGGACGGGNGVDGYTAGTDSEDDNKNYGDTIVGSGCGVAGGGPSRGAAPLVTWLLVAVAWLRRRRSVASGD
ncbi:MAG: trypsin-like serine protease [Myxococcales bacterium]|nr:trypsin-like serine protease [Myxococcales bacterium]